MKLNINLEEDKELRAYIKDIIKGQVLSVVREDIFNIAKQAFESRVKNQGLLSVEAIFKDKIKDIVERELKSSVWDGAGVIKDEAKRLVKEKVNEFFANQKLDKI